MPPPPIPPASTHGPALVPPTLPEGAALSDPVRPGEIGGPRYGDVLAAVEVAVSGRGSRIGSILLLIGSLVVFVGLGAAGWSWDYALALIPVLLFHELGHFAAMRAFGYANVRMFFIPLFGAAVSGRHFDVAGWKKVVVSLMGPAPGILAGMSIGILGLALQQPLLTKGATLLIILNGFNLLPILPLDGGWIMHTLLFSRHPSLDAGFRLLAALGLGGLAVAFGEVVLGVLAALTLLGVPLAYRTALVTQRLRARGLATRSDGRSVPRETAIAIVAELVPALPQRATAKTIATHTLQVFESLNSRPPGPWLTAALLVVHVGVAFVALVALVVVALGSR